MNDIIQCKTSMLIKAAIQTDHFSRYKDGHSHHPCEGASQGDAHWRPTEGVSCCKISLGFTSAYIYRELLAGDLKLKPTDSTEKNVLPTAEDMKQEKNHQGILTGIEGFTSNSLKPTETKEKVVLPGKEEIKAEKTIQGMLQVCKNSCYFVLINIFFFPGC